jgi:hypothetical protein
MPGWGLSNTGEIPEILEAASLKILRNYQCENICLKLEGIRVPLHSRILCTAARPFVLMQFVSISFTNVNHHIDKKYFAALLVLKNSNKLIF